MPLGGARDEPSCPYRRRQHVLPHVESGILLGVDTLNTNERCVCPLSTLAARKRHYQHAQATKAWLEKAGKSEKVKHTA